MTTTILLVEDSEVFARGLGSMLASTGEFSIVDVAATVEEAKVKVENLKPDIVIVDLRIPRTLNMPPERVHGIELVRYLREHYQGLPILVLSSAYEEQWIQRAVEAGAAGFVNKDQSEERLIEALRALNSGQMVVPRSVAMKVITHREMRNALLTPREVEVLRLVARGMSNREIAQTLGISEGTVRAHVSHILNKLGVSSRYAAVHKAREYGMDI